jgi:hypothetical protein
MLIYAYTDQIQTYIFIYISIPTYKCIYMCILIRYRHIYAYTCVL